MNAPPRWLFDCAVAASVLNSIVDTALASDNPDYQACAQPGLLDHARKLIEAVQADRREAVPLDAKVLPMRKQA